MFGLCECSEFFSENFVYLNQSWVSTYISLGLKFSLLYCHICNSASSQLKKNLSRPQVWYCHWLCECNFFWFARFWTSAIPWKVDPVHGTVDACSIGVQPFRYLFQTDAYCVPLSRSQTQIQSSVATECHRRYVPTAQLWRPKTQIFIIYWNPPNHHHSPEYDQLDIVVSRFIKLSQRCALQ